MSRTKARDLVGTEINGFKVLDWKRENNRSYLFVICPICGKKKWMRKDNVDNPKIVSCGCYNKKNNYIKQKDITGQVFGRLTAVRKTSTRSPSGATIWECRCSCGNTTYVGISELTLGRINSCGCLRSETSHENGKNAGKYIKDNFCIENTNINNLTAKKPKNNTSGVKGVSWDKARQKWLAQIVFQGKYYHLGRFDRKEDATEARKEAEEKLYGDFLYWHNFIRSEELDFDTLRSIYTSKMDAHFIDRVESIYKKIKDKEEIKVNSSDYHFIAQQKYNYSKSKKWRKELLKETGILKSIENRNAYSFDYKFRRAKKYYEEFGNLRVPPNYVDKNGFALGKWILNLRTIYRGESKGFLDEERIQKLNSIGMEWSVYNKLTWDEWYDIARAYYEENGNLKIPYKLEVNGHKIGIWIFNQRDARNNPKSRRKITQDQIDKLDKIGMIWNRK